MPKVFHPDEERTDHNGTPLYLRAEIFTAGWRRRTFTTRCDDVKELVMAFEGFQRLNPDALHLDLYAFAEMAGLTVLRWPPVPPQQRHQ